MAGKKRIVDDFTKDIPTSLEGHPFYGLSIDDEEQLHYRDSIWNPEKKIILCDAVAGSGKTTIAIATACLLYHYGLYDGCYYIRTNSSEKLGFLPGSLAEKEKPYMLPLYNTIMNIGENPYTAINDGSMEAQKNGTGFFSAFTDAYILGTDWSKKVVVIDEAECMTTDALRAIITRCHDDCKVIVIGSSLQIQGIKKDASGFAHCIEHFSDRPWAEVCHLTKNYRGEMSAWADKL